MTDPILGFYGAARTVTGSRHLVETDDARVLVDCGLFQGLKKLRLRNWNPPPFEPASVDAIVLTHAHIDHCGYIPAFVRAGFEGPVYATASTRALAAIVLPDAGRLQEEEAAFANRHRYSKHAPALPLFTERDAYAALERFRTVTFGETFEAASGVTAAFRPAGHILGSATATLTVDGRTVLFSGDLGRPQHPILVAPDPPDGADVVVTESTYGDREHSDEGAIERFKDTIVRTASRGGTVVIPAFAVDRTEVLLYHLRRLDLGGLPVYVDSPMALAALDVYRKAIASGAADVRDGFETAGDPFDTGRLIEAHNVEASKAIARAAGPAVIVSASGMATGGRVLHHLARLLPGERNTVILPGFQGEGTRGRALLEGAREIKLLGRYVQVRAEVVNISAFSVHADRSELLDWLGSATRAPDAVYMVHGEPDAAFSLRDAVRERLGWTAVVPRYEERVRLD